MGSDTDVYFGVKVADPYRWLENDTAPEVEAWVQQQNEITQNYLQKIPFREDLNKRLTAISNYEKIGAPFKKHGKYYFYRNDGLQNQSVLYVKETLDGEAEVLLDPNTLSDDGTVALNGISFSPADRRPHRMGQVHQRGMARRWLLLQLLRPPRSRQGILQHERKPQDFLS